MFINFFYSKINRVVFCSSSLHMLTAIEGKMEELFEELESLPPGKVEAAEKVQCSILFHMLQQSSSLLNQ